MFAIYKSLNSDLVGMVRAQGGYVNRLGWPAMPLMNTFFGGPTMGGICAERFWPTRPHARHHHG